MLTSGSAPIPQHNNKITVPNEQNNRNKNIIRSHPLLNANKKLRQHHHRWYLLLRNKTA